MPDLSEEQAALYTLGLLEPADASDVEARLGSDPVLGGLVKEFWEVQAFVLGFAAAQDGYRPSAALKRKVLARIDAEAGGRSAQCHAGRKK